MIRFLSIGFSLLSIGLLRLSLRECGLASLLLFLVMVSFLGVRVFIEGVDFEIVIVDSCSWRGRGATVGCFVEGAFPFGSGD